MTSRNESQSSTAILQLEIHHGRTQYRQRPVSAGRFLIGASEACDLRFGGRDIPPLHSILIVRDDGSAEIESMGSAPDLIINGVVTDRSVVRCGDCIEIGAFSFNVQPTGTASPQKQIDDPSTAEIPIEECLAEKTVESTVDLSAADLVGRLERDEDLVEMFESRRELGLEALLKAVLTENENRNTAETTADEPAATVKMPVPAAESEPVVRTRHRAIREIVEQLGRTAADLEAQASHASKSSASTLETAADLLRTQQTLALNVDRMLQQIDHSTDQRAIA